MDKLETVPNVDGLEILQEEPTRHFVRPTQHKHFARGRIWYLLLSNSAFLTVSEQGYT